MPDPQPPAAPSPSVMEKKPPAVLTHFASPERSNAEEIQRETDALSRVGNLDALLDAMPDLVMILNHNRQIIFANRNLREFGENHGCPAVYGMRPGELLRCERVHSAPSGCGTGEGCSTCGAVQAILTGLAGSSVKKDCRVSIADSGALDLRIWASPFVWGESRYVLVVAADISNENRRKALERIFFHDLLNTAGGISGMIMLLADGISTIENLKDDLCHTADALINEIKSQQILLAAETHELIANPVLLQSKEVLESAMAQLRNHPVASGKHIRIAPESASFALMSDEILLNRILCNLIKNAFEASREGEAVTIGARHAQGESLFWCHNASAMPRDVQHQVFQRSFSTKGPGRGLGTYSVRLLAERYLHGKVSFESREETGTIFKIFLPG